MPPQLLFAHCVSASRARRRRPAWTCSRACCELFTHGPVARGGAAVPALVHSVMRPDNKNPSDVRLIWYISNLPNLRGVDPNQAMPGTVEPISQDTTQAMAL